LAQKSTIFLEGEAKYFFNIQRALSEKVEPKYQKETRKIRNINFILSEKSWFGCKFKIHQFQYMSI